MATRDSGTIWDLDRQYERRQARRRVREAMRDARRLDVSYTEMAQLALLLAEEEECRDR